MLLFSKQVKLERLSSLLNWCDIAYFEWCDESLQFGLTLRPDKFIVARLHRYELFTPLVTTMDWSSVDLLLFNTPGDAIPSKFRKRVDNLPRNMKSVPDGIDLDQFKYVNRKWKPPYNIGMAGSIIPRKRVYTAIQMLYDLPSDEYNLNIVGKLGDEEFEHSHDLIDKLKLGDRVKILPHIKPDEMQNWYAQQHFILSNSTHEGNHNTIKEGMATGCIPLINCWDGANDVFPERYIFYTPANFVKLAEDTITSDPLEDQSTYCSDFIFKHYDSKKSAIVVREAIEEVYDGA